MAESLESRLWKRFEDEVESILHGYDVESDAGWHDRGADAYILARRLARSGWGLILDERTHPEHNDGSLLDRPSAPDAGSVDQDAGPGGRAGRHSDGSQGEGVEG